MKRRSDLRAALALAGALATLLLSAAAHAYCRTANCPTEKDAWQVCEPEQSTDCGEPLWWARPCVGYTLQKDASSQVSLADAETVLQAAFATWTSADCGGGSHPNMAVEYQGTVECHVQEYNKEKDKANANVIMFRDDTWPYENTASILALTTVTYNTETSEIYDADMEINTFDIKDFTLGDGDAKYDLLSIATHEAGHFLGLAHSADPDATMFADYKIGSVTLRDLTPDDIAGICAAIPPGMPDPTCDTTPRHGFSSLCGVDQPDIPDGGGGGCAVSAPPAAGASPAASSGDVAPWALLAGGLGLVSITRRRRRRKAV